MARVELKPNAQSALGTDFEPTLDSFEGAEDRLGKECGKEPASKLPDLRFGQWDGVLVPCQDGVQSGPFLVREWKSGGSPPISLKRTRGEEREFFRFGGCHGENEVFVLQAALHDARHEPAVRIVSERLREIEARIGSYRLKDRATTVESPGRRPEYLGLGRVSAVRPHPFAFTAPFFPFAFSGPSPARRRWARAKELKRSS